jgi:hypothetical protein
VSVRETQQVGVAEGNLDLFDPARP